MEFVKLTFDGTRYNYSGGTTVEMDILGCFLLSDVASSSYFFKTWALEDTKNEEIVFSDAVNGDLTHLERNGDHIFLENKYADNPYPVKLQMPKKEFIKLLDIWDQSIFYIKPKKITIKKAENNFCIEVSNDSEDNEIM